LAVYSIISMMHGHTNIKIFTNVCIYCHCEHNFYKTVTSSSATYFGWFWPSSTKYMYVCTYVWKNVWMYVCM